MVKAMAEAEDCRPRADKCPPTDYRANKDRVIILYESDKRNGKRA